MTPEPEEAWLRVAGECPRRIITALHRSGEYHHGNTPRFPDKVLCCHRDTALPEGWSPTQAQQQAWLADQPVVQSPQERVGEDGAGSAGVTAEAAGV